ncbi:hypothetical protein AB0C38_13615 [Amycolatopsis sp. NPDC048633]|uniref:hypothetical protein n=1 Tax=Amycolatopsis sp. NPDC048633 TaxID=3157095 RepID=UPI0033C89DBD
MCNPRRVRVRATRDLQRTWADEVRRQVTRRGTVAGEARIREPLAADIGAPTLAALATVLERSDDWDWDGERFTHPLDGGLITLDPVTRELEIVARLTDEVAVTGEARQAISGTVEERIDVVGEGVWYDDGYGGWTARTAREEAQQDAERALAREADALVARRRAEAEAREAGRLDAAASADADRAMAEATAARRRELEAAAVARLDLVGVQGRNLFHAVLAEAYRDAIVAYARSHGAGDVLCTDHDGVLEIQFEMPA